MEEDKDKSLAQQLRRPEGEMGLQVAERMNQGNQYMNKNTIEQLNPQPKEHILEIGMGNGFFVKEILIVHPTIRYTGCDFSALMVQESIKNNQEWINKNQAQFFNSTADKVPCAPHSFDKIFTINTLYFWENPPEILAELKRVLKPNGKLLITIRPKKYMEQFGFTKYGFTMYSQQEAMNLLLTNGWEILEVIEKHDPPIDWFGEQLAPESLIIIAKNKTI